MKKRFPQQLDGTIATIFNDPYGQGFFRLGTDTVIRTTDEFLMSKGGLCALPVYQRLLIDSTVQSAFNKLHQEIVSRDLVVEPASEDKLDLEVAEFVRKILEEKLPIDTITRGFLEAKILGFKVGEILWENSPEGVLPYAINMCDGRRFQYVQNKDGTKELRLLTQDNMMNGMKLPPRKFMVLKYYTVYDGCDYGRGLGEVLHPLVKFKRRAQESELILSDRFAIPHSIIKMPLNALESEVNAIYDLFSNLSQETALLIPEGYEVDFLTPEGKVDIFTGIKDHCIRDINVLLCGENEVGNVDAGSRASSETANDLRITMAKEVSEIFHEFLNSTLVRWVVDLNYGTNVKIPKVYRNFKSTTNTPLTISDVVQLWEKFKLRAKQSWIEAEFNIEFEEMPTKVKAPKPQT